MTLVRNEMIIILAGHYKSLGEGLAAPGRTNSTWVVIMIVILHFFDISNRKICLADDVGLWTVEGVPCLLGIIKVLRVLKAWLEES